MVDGGWDGGVECARSPAKIASPLSLALSVRVPWTGNLSTRTQGTRQSRQTDKTSRLSGMLITSDHSRVVLQHTPSCSLCNTLGWCEEKGWEEKDTMSALRRRPSSPVVLLSTRPQRLSACQASPRMSTLLRMASFQ